MPTGKLIARHPSQLYEATLEGLVLFLDPVVVHEQAAAAIGAAGLFLVVYGCARFAVEWVRLPDANIGYLVGDWLTMGMLLTIPMILAAAIAMMILCLPTHQPSGNLSAAKA